MTELLTGTVAFLFTDVEGSTKLLHDLGDEYAPLLRDHHALLGESVKAYSGRVVDTQGDSFFCVFPRVKDAAAAAADAQRRLAVHEWPEGSAVKVRMGIHAAEPELEDGRYVGLGVHRAARVGSAAHGGQVLLSHAAAAMLGDSKLALRDLGAYTLKDFDKPERLYQLTIDGQPAKFPPPRTGTPKRRRRRLLALALLPILAAAIALPLLLTGGSGSIKVGPTSLAVVDPKSNKVVDAIDLGFKSSLIAAGEGYVWAVDPKGSTLVKIDPHTRKVVSRIGISVGAGAIPFGLAAGEGAVWVAVLRGTRQVVLELGPEVGDLRRTIPYGGEAQAPVLFRLHPLAVGGGAVWAIDSAVGGIWRIPHAGKARKLAEGLDALSLTAGGGAVWVAGSSGVTKLDAATGLELGSASIGSQAFGETASVALGGNAVWFAASSGQTLSKLDPQSVATTQTFSVGKGPSGIAVGEGAVWTANSRDGTLSRVDPQGGQPLTIRLGQTPGGVVADYRAIWTSPGEPRS